MGKTIAKYFCDTITGTMPVNGPPDISGLLAAWNKGDPEALGSLMEVVYPEVHRIAHLHLARRAPGHTLESAALANEAYLKLLRAGGIPCESRVHFLALCSQMIRRLLLDHARNRGYAKRGGDLVRVTLDEGQAAAAASGTGMFALDEALKSLAKIDARKARVVELRYFGGLTIEETADLLGVSVETAKRDWKLAKAWLFAALQDGRACAKP